MVRIEDPQKRRNVKRSGVVGSERTAKFPFQTATEEHNERAPIVQGYFACTHVHYVHFPEEYGRNQRQVAGYTTRSPPTSTTMTAVHSDELTNCNRLRRATIDQQPQLLGGATSMHGVHRFLDLSNCISPRCYTKFFNPSSLPIDSAAYQFVLVVRIPYSLLQQLCRNKNKHKKMKA